MYILNFKHFRKFRFQKKNPGRQQQWQGSQEEVPKQGFPARGSQARFPGTGRKQGPCKGSQEGKQGFQEEVPKQGSHE